MSNELYHHGIRGQKWGVRRFQNADGSLTPAGRRRESIRDENDSGQNLYNRFTGRGNNKPNMLFNTGAIKNAFKSEGDGKRSNEQKELSPYQKARYKYDENGRLVKKNLKNMTNEELKESTERLALEEKYNKQSKDFRESKTKSKQAMSTGGKVVGSVLLTSGLILMKHALTDPKPDKNETAEQKKERYEKLRNEVLLSAGTVAIGVLASDKGLKTS